MIASWARRRCRCRCVESRGFSFDLDMLRDQLSTARQDGDPELAAESDRRRDSGATNRAIADMVRERDLMVLSDEIYSRIYYGEPPVSIASFPGMLEKTIILDGFSKTYAMTGWRMGYGVMPEWLVDAVNKLMVNSNSCTASFTQRAGIAALTGPQDDVDADGGRVPPPPRRVLRRAEPDPGLPLRASRRRVLRLRQYRRAPGCDSKELRRSPAERGRRGLPQRRGVRPVRRRLHALQLRQFATRT